MANSVPKSTLVLIIMGLFSLLFSTTLLARQVAEAEYRTATYPVEKSKYYPTQVGYYPSPSGGYGGYDPPPSGGYGGYGSRGYGVGYGQGGYGGYDPPPSGGYGGYGSGGYGGSYGRGGYGGYDPPPSGGYGGYGGGGYGGGYGRGGYGGYGRGGYYPPQELEAQETVDTEEVNPPQDKETKN